MLKPATSAMATVRMIFREKFIVAPFQGGLGGLFVRVLGKKAEWPERAPRPFEDGRFGGFKWCTSPSRNESGRPVFGGGRRRGMLEFFPETGFGRVCKRRR